MSKAFVREDGEGAPPAPDLPPLPPGPRPVTREGYARLAAELAALEAAAPSQGVRSEASERRSLWLRRLLGVLSIVEAKPEDPERISFGAFATVEDDAGATSTYRLVGPDEVDAAAGWISVESPVGRALLGRSAGEDAIARRPRGETRLRVTRVRYELVAEPDDR